MFKIVPHIVEDEEYVDRGRVMIRVRMQFKGGQTAEIHLPAIIKLIGNKESALNLPKFETPEDQLERVLTARDLAQVAE